jgi:DNA-binding MarR family transcriptional regulator
MGSPDELARAAEALYDAATAFIRFYQFRDRGQALRFGLTVVQAYALDILLSSGGQSLTSLAQALQLDKSTTSRVVSGMTARALVEWSRPENDGRAMWIVASADGKRRYAALRRAIVRENGRLLASYSSSARRAAIKLLRDLTERARGAPTGSSAARRASSRSRVRRT